MSYPPQNQGYPPTNQGYPLQQTTAQYPANNPPPQGMVYQASPQQYPSQPQQAYYQPGQPYPQGQPQVPYGQQPTFQTVTVQPQPAKFEHVPVTCQCPHCHATINSKVQREIGSTTWVYCLLFSCVGCCCCPFFMDCAKDVSHSCPNCKNHLATFKQPVVQSGGGDGSTPKYDHTFGGPGDCGTGGGAVDQSGGD